MHIWMAFPNKLHMLRHKNSNHVGFQKGNHSYLLGFSNIKHVQLMNEVVNTSTMFDVNIKATLTRSTQLVDLRVYKNLNIKNKECDIIDIDIAKFLCYPIIDNIGVLIGMELLKEEPYEVIFESLMIDPFNNPKYFHRSKYL